MNAFPLLCMISLLVCMIPSNIGCCEDTASGGSLRLDTIAEIDCKQPVGLVAISESGKTVCAATFSLNGEPVYSPAKFNTELMVAQSQHKFAAKVELRFPGHRIDHLSLSNDGQCLAHSISGRTARLVALGEHGHGSFFSSGSDVVLCAISPTTHTLAYIEEEESEDSHSLIRTLHLTRSDATSGRSEKIDMNHATRMIAWSRDEGVMAVVTGRYKVELWKGSPARVSTVIERRSEDEGLDYEITGIAFSPDGTLLCCSGQAGFTIWKLPEARLVADFKDTTVFISEIAFSADSSKLVACEHVVSGELLQPGRIPVGTSISRWSIGDGKVSRTGQTSLAFTAAKFSNSGTALCFVAPKQPSVVQLARLAE